MADKNIDKYDVLLEILGYRSDHLTITDEEILRFLPQTYLLAKEIGLELSPRKGRLILWNDDINNMMYVVQVLTGTAGLDLHIAFEKMYEAHEKGSTVIREDTIFKLIRLAALLRKKNLKASIDPLQQ